MKYFVAETKRFKEESRNGVKLSSASDFEAIERAVPNRRDNDKYRIKPYYHARKGHLVSVYRYEQRTINGLDVCCYFALCVLAHDEAYKDFVDSRTDDKRREQVVGWKDLHVTRIEGNTGCETGAWNGIEEVWAEIAKRLSEGKEDGLRSLSDKEYNFLYDNTHIVEDLFQSPIFETKEWVDILAKDERTSGYEHIIELANGISRKYEEWATDPGQEKFIVYKEPFYNDINKQQDQYFLCWGVRGDEKKIGGDEIDRWFNISVGTLAEIEAVEEKYRNYFNKGDYKRLARHCRRGYPYKILEQNKDVWKKMEEDKNSSLVLSDEELDVLSSHLTYPLFLTGRAGSGKSTMLQYLFSEYVIRYVASKIGTPPLYLSWSEFLVAKARDVATTLLEKNPAYTKVLDDYGIVYGQDVKPILPSLFKSFAELVKDCIRQRKPGVLSKRFAAGKYVSFPLFKIMWNERFGQDHEAATKYGPELSWHVIRSYIKGWDCAKLLQPSDFNAIGKSYQDVSEDEYKLVYNKVWKDWYSKIGNDRRWDDLDLVRYCLQPDDGSESCISEGTYSAIFCDESQDFTRVETELILKLSIFTQRKLNVDDVSRLPIVFAGDEAQTLNPTGFSWDSLRSYFTDRLNTMLHLKDRAASLSAPPTRTLKQNYRSLPPIVRLGNRIQLLRHIMGLGSDEKFERQLSYDEGSEGKPVYCLNPNDPDVWTKLQELNTVVIIPSNDGQTDEEFFRSTPVGRERMIEFYDSGENKGDAIGLTIFNPMQAKGQEFPCVAVYGFDLPEILSKRLSGVTLLDELTGEKRDLNGVRSQEIALKYFLSNAYVAVTRAETQLFILSNCRDPHTFWSFAYQSANNVDENVSGRIEDAMLKRLQEENKDRDACTSKDIRGLIIAGGVDTLESGEVADAHVVAQRAYNLGKSRADARAMRKAASKYSDIGDEKQATICKGFAFGYEGRYEEAAKCFSSAGWRNKAIESYWLALNKESEERIIPSLAGIGGTRIEVRIATQLKNADITYASLKQYLEEITSSIRQNDQHVAGSLNENNDVANGEDVIGTSFYEQQETWQFVLGRLLDKLPPFRAIDTQHIKVILNQFDKLSSYEVEVPVDKVSRLAIAAKCYTWVIAAWERKYTDDWLKREGVGAQSYWLAKAALTDDYSEKVMCLKLSGLDDWKQRVVREFMQNEEHFPSGKEARSVVAEAGMESDSVSLVRKSAACLLSSATTIDRGETWVGNAFNKEGMVPFSRVCAYAMLRTHIHVNFDKIGYIKKNGTPKAGQLFSVLEKILSVSGDEFWEKLKTTRAGTFDVAKDVVSSELLNPWISYLAVAMGAVLEERQYFVDCLKYYEWVIKNSANPDLNALMRMRWIKNKDRQLDLREQLEKLNGPVDSAYKRKIAMEIALERSSLKRIMDSNNITSIDTIPDSFNIDWEQFFEEVFREIPADVDSSPEDNDGKGPNKEENNGKQESKGPLHVEEKPSELEHVNVDDKENIGPVVDPSSADTKIASKIDNDNDVLTEKGEEMSLVKSRNDGSMVTQPSVDENKLERWEQNFARNDGLCFKGTINITPSEENPGSVWIDLTDCHDMNGEVNVPRFACKEQDVVGVQSGSSVLGRRNPMLPDRPFFFSGNKMPIEVIDWRELKIEGSIRDLLSKGTNASVRVSSKCLFEDVLIVDEDRIYSGLRYSDKRGEIIVGNELREGDVDEFFAKNKAQCLYYLLDWGERGLFRLIAPKNNIDIGTQTILESVGPMINGNSEENSAKGSKNGGGGQSDTKYDECRFLQSFAKYVERCGFIYSPRDLVRFHTSVKCCMFTLLGGTPGNGKSSLAKLYFQMLTGSGADSHDRNIRINVQSTWLEADDLENAPNVRYKDFLSKAINERDMLYCACFEEVNLARIEHYMADIIQEIGKRPDVLESEMCEEMRGGKCKLPPNIRFVGTCNEDASVQPISRRFYDRCNKIELSVYNREAQIENAFGLKDARVLPLKPEEGGGITYSDFKTWCQIDPKIRLDEVRKAFDALLPELEKIDAHPSPRVIGEIARYVALRPAFDAPGDSNKVSNMALDEAIVQRILPCCQPTPATIEYYGEEKLQKTLRDHHMDLSAEYVKSLKDDYDHIMMA